MYEEKGSLTALMGFAPAPATDKATPFEMASDLDNELCAAKRIAPNSCRSTLLSRTE